MIITFPTKLDDVDKNGNMFPHVWRQCGALDLIGNRPNVSQQFFGFWTVIKLLKFTVGDSVSQSSKIGVVSLLKGKEFVIFMAKSY